MLPSVDDAVCIMDLDDVWGSVDVGGLPVVVGPTDSVLLEEIDAVGS